MKDFHGVCFLQLGNLVCFLLLFIIIIISSNTNNQITTTKKPFLKIAANSNLMANQNKLKRKEQLIWNDFKTLQPLIWWNCAELLLLMLFQMIYVWKIILPWQEQFIRLIAIILPTQTTEFCLKRRKFVNYHFAKKLMEGIMVVESE